MKRPLKILENLVGTNFVGHLAEFATALFKIREPFLANLAKVTSVLKSEQAAFIMVSGPASKSAGDLDLFLRRLGEKGYLFDGLVINRTLSHFGSELPDHQKAREIILEAQKQDQAAVQAFQKHTSSILKIPEFSRDIHSIRDLLSVTDAFGNRASQGRGEVG